MIKEGDTVLLQIESFDDVHFIQLKKGSIIKIKKKKYSLENLINQPYHTFFGIVKKITKN